MDQAKLLAEVKAKDTDYKELWDRMDEDNDLFNLEPYVFTDYTGTDEFPESYSSTSPAPWNFLTVIKGAIDEAEITLAITADEKRGGITPTECTRKEEVFNDTNDGKEEWHKLINFGESYTSKQNARMLRRGWAVTRVIIQKEMIDGKERLVLDYQVWDARYTKWAYGMHGKLAWASYKQKYSQSDALTTFGVNDKIVEKIKSAFKGTTTELEIISCYTPDMHYIWVENKLLHEEENPYGVVPVIITPSEMGSSIVDSSGGMKRMGESILAALRDTIDNTNRVNSTILSKSQEGYRSTVIIYVPEGKLAEVKKVLQSPPEKSGAGNIKLIPLPEGASRDNMYPREHVDASDGAAKEIVDSNMTQGTVSALDYGDFNRNNPPSGAAMRHIADQKRRIITPFVHGLQWHRAMVDMLTRHIMVKMKYSGEIGVQGRKAEYRYQDYEGVFMLEYEYQVKIAEQDIANVMIAGEYINIGIDHEMAYENAGFADPPGMVKRSSIQRAREISQSYDLYCTANDMESEDKYGAAIIRLEMSIAILKSKQDLEMLQSPVPTGNILPSGPAPPPMIGGSPSGTPTPKQEGLVPPNEGLGMANPVNGGPV